MSHDVALRFDTRRSTGDLRAFVESLPQFALTGQLLHAAGVNSVDVLVEDAFSRRVVSEQYGISPSVSVVFEVDKFDESNEGYMNAMRAICAILQNFPGEGVVLHDGHSRLLQRRGNRIEIDHSTQLWNERMLALVRTELSNAASSTSQ